MENLDKEAKRRGVVVDIFPNAEAVIRPVGTLQAEPHEEWQESRRLITHDSLAPVLTGSQRRHAALP